MDRKALRTELRTRRREIPPAQRISAAQSLATRLLALPFAPDAGFVAGYWAVDGEIALHAWQLGLPAGATYCLPVLHDDRCLRFAPWRPGEPLKANRYGIPEPDVASERLIQPQALSMVVVPLVGFDVRGQRLGMGAGWYDRSFAFRRENRMSPCLVGAAFGIQKVERLDSEAWDVPLDAICTDNDTYLSSGTGHT